MITIFNKIPDLFVELYDAQFRQWAREFRERTEKFGPQAAIVFNPVPGQSADLDEHGQTVWKGAWFRAEVDKSNPANVRVIISPKTPHDEEMVLKHTFDMSPHRLN